MKRRTFEECLPEINIEIAKRAPRWQLSGVPSISFDDVSQILRIHLFKKFHLYSQDLPLAPWVNRILTRQIINLIRNLYGNFSRPCLRCPANEGANLCQIYQIQCAKCNLFAKWEKGKKNAHDIKLAVTMENHTQEVYDKPSDFVDIERAGAELHKKIRPLLKPIEWKAYKHLFIKFKEEDELSQILGFKTNEKGRAAGYRQIGNLKKSIIGKVKKLLSDGEIDFY